MTPDEFMLFDDDECPRCGLGVSDCECEEREDDVEEDCNCGDFACPCGTDVRWVR